MWDASNVHPQWYSGQGNASTSTILFGKVDLPIILKAGTIFLIGVSTNKYEIQIIAEQVCNYDWFDLIRFIKSGCIYLDQCHC